MSQVTSIEVVGAAIVRGDRCFAAQRAETMSNPLLWEFPGGKREHGEGPHEALRREIQEEFAVEIEVLEKLATGTETNTRGQQIVLDVYRARLVYGEPQAQEHVDAGWFTADELRQRTFAQADHAPLRAVLKILENLQT